MKRLNKIVESAIGFVPMFLLWLIGSFSHKSFYVDMFTAHRGVLHPGAIIPVVVICLMPVLLQICAVLGKIFDSKLLYISAIIGMGLPAISTLLFDMFSNDGNILSWIFGFTIGIPLIPFGRLADSVFEGVDKFCYIYMNHFLEYNDVIRIYFLAIVISAILFLIIKRKSPVKKNQ